MKKRSNIFFGLIIVLAIVVRLWGINAGMPYVRIHIDENGMVNSALALVPLKGALWTSGNGFLMPYLLFPIYAVYFLAGSLTGTFTSLEGFLVSYVSETGNFILIGRLFNVLLSVTSVYLIYKVARKWFGEKIALLASFFLAVSFIHVKESHYVKNDVLVGLIVLLIMHECYLVIEKGKLKNYVLAGIFTGLAFGAKIYPVFAGIYILVAHYVRTKKLSKFFNKNIFAALFFLILTVFIQIAPTFLNKGGIGEFLRIGRIIKDISSEKNQLVAVSYLVNLKEGTGIPIFILSILGILVSFSKVKENKYKLLLSFAVIYLATIDLWTGYSQPRHVIILLPSFVIFAGIGLVEITDKFLKIGHRKLGIFCLVFLVSIPTLIRTVKMNFYFNGLDTRAIAKKWVEKNVPSGSKIVVEGTLKPYIPGGAAPLFLSEDAIKKEIAQSENLGALTLSLKALLKANAGRVAYDILATPKIDRKYDTLIGKETQMTNVSYYLSENYKFIVTMNWAQYRGLDPDFEADFRKNYTKIAKFDPGVNFSANPHDTFIEYDKLDSIDLFSENITVGPYVEIFRLIKNDKR